MPKPHSKIVNNNICFRIIIIFFLKTSIQKILKGNRKNQ